MVKNARRKYNIEDKKIAFNQVFTSSFIRKANEHLQACIDYKKIWFASKTGAYESFFNTVLNQGAANLDLIRGEDKKDWTTLDFIENQDDYIYQTKKQCALVEHSSTSRGTQRSSYKRHRRSNRCTRSHRTNNRRRSKRNSNSSNNTNYRRNTATTAALGSNAHCSDKSRALHRRQVATKCCFRQFRNTHHQHLFAGGHTDKFSCVHFIASVNSSRMCVYTGLKPYREITRSIAGETHPSIARTLFIYAQPQSIFQYLACRASKSLPPSATMFIARI
jgi:hypothetical protein